MPSKPKNGKLMRMPVLGSCEARSLAQASKAMADTASMSVSAALRLVRGIEGKGAIGRFPSMTILAASFRHAETIPRSARYSCERDHTSVHAQRIDQGEQQHGDESLSKARAMVEKMRHRDDNDPS